jgi:hypothetical protein
VAGFSWACAPAPALARERLWVARLACSLAFVTGRGRVATTAGLASQLAEAAAKSGLARARLPQRLLSG